MTSRRNFLKLLGVGTATPMILATLKDGPTQAETNDDDANPVASARPVLHGTSTFSSGIVASTSACWIGESSPEVIVPWTDHR